MAPLLGDLTTSQVRETYWSHPKREVGKMQWESDKKEKNWPFLSTSYSSGIVPYARVSLRKSLDSFIHSVQQTATEPQLLFKDQVNSKGNFYQNHPTTKE